MVKPGPGLRAVHLAAHVLPKMPIILSVFLALRLRHLRNHLPPQPHHQLQPKLVLARLLLLVQGLLLHLQWAQEQQHGKATLIPVLTFGPMLFMPRKLAV